MKLQMNMPMHDAGLDISGYKFELVDFSRFIHSPEDSLITIIYL